MSQPETILGLALGERRVQAVAVLNEGSERTLLAIDEWANTLPLRTSTNGAGVTRFTESLSDFITQNRLRPERASVTIDSGQTFIATIPFEEGVSRLERNDHMRWELSQFFPDSQAGDFITDVQPITDNKIDRWTRTLSVSVPKKIPEVIFRALDHLGLGLHVLDVDHFSADTALRFNYPDVERRYMALVGVKENRVDVSMMRHGVLESYSYHIVSSNTEIVEHIGTLSREGRGLYSLTAYGTFLDMDLLVQIRRGASLLVEALNPLRHVRIADSLRLSDRLAVPSYRFAAAVGVALRQD